MNKQIDTPTNTPTNTPTQNQFTNSELKQIEEMAKDIATTIELIECEAWHCSGCKYEKYSENYMCNSIKQAEKLTALGYRKTEDIAREIIKEIDDDLHDMAIEYEKAGHPEYFAVCEMVHHKVIRPIKKKYTEGEK